MVKYEKQSRILRVKCRGDGELPGGRKKICGAKFASRCENEVLWFSFSAILAGKEDFFMQATIENKKFASIFDAKYWKEAAQQLSDVKMITIAALMVALRIVVKFIKIPIAQGLSISLDAYVNSLGSVIYGPLVGDRKSVV